MELDQLGGADFTAPAAAGSTVGEEMERWREQAGRGWGCGLRSNNFPLLP